MSEEKRFNDRKCEFPNRYRAEIISQSPSKMIVDLFRDCGVVEVQGTAINAELFNEFDTSIKDALSKSQIAETYSSDALSKAEAAIADSADALNIANQAFEKVNKLDGTIAESSGTVVTIGETAVSGLTFSSDPQTQLNSKLDKSGLLDLVYPVGSIYMSMSATNPGTIIGGTWVRWANGRVPLSQSDSDNDFKVAGNIGGDKNYQSHNHCLEVNDSTGLTGSLTFKTYSSATSGTGIFVESWSDSGVTPSGTSKDKNVTVDFDANHKHTGVTDYHGTGQGKNMPPYMVCYMWKRTA